MEGKLPFQISYQHNFDMKGEKKTYFNVFMLFGEEVFDYEYYFQQCNVAIVTLDHQNTAIPHLLFCLNCEVIAVLSYVPV